MQIIMDWLLKFIVDEAMGIVPALWVLGYILKQTPKVQNWVIPWILLIFGTVGTVLIFGPNVKGISQGLVVTGLAVLAHQLIKQTTNGTNRKNNRSTPIDSINKLNRNRKL